jgi:dopamine beta-monooxygenase
MLLLFGINCCLLLVPSLGYIFYQKQIPNGNRVHHPCKANYLWPGVGHKNAKGGGERNTFGADFSLAGHKWTQELCSKDSDGDGKTNGQELGDPNCVWSPGQSPSRIADITHPGVCDPFNSSTCRGKNDFVTCALDAFEGCDVIKKPEIRTVDLVFNKTEVPAVETTYMCMTFYLPVDQDYHIVASEPIIDNADVLHHMLLYACDEDVDLTLSEPVPCGMSLRGCTSIIGSWSVGLSGQCFGPKAGYRIGLFAFKRVNLQVHYNNPRKVSTHSDSSGLRLYIQPALPGVPDMATLMTGQTLLSIPPGQEKVTHVGVCPSYCSQKMLNQPLYVMAAANHMHYLGSSMKVELFRAGVKLIDITNEDHYSYDSPVVFNHDPAIEIRPGDDIRTTCVFNSKSSVDYVEFGLATSDEMCFGFLFTYPRDALNFHTGCDSHGRLSQCDIREKTPVDGCDWAQYLYRTNITSIAEEVTRKCNVTCSPECSTYLQSLRDHPCLNGEIAEVIKDKLQERIGGRFFLDTLYPSNKSDLCSTDNVTDNVSDEGTKSTFAFTAFMFATIAFIAWS